MSALTIDYPFAPAPLRSGRGAVVIPFPNARARTATGAAAAPLRITRRGRLAVTLVVSAVLAVAGLLGASQAVAGQEARPVPVESVVVVPGDTLWGIAAGSAAPGEDVRDVVAEIVELNGLTSSGVVVGQQLVVPVTG